MDSIVILSKAKDPVDSIVILSKAKDPMDSCVILRSEATKDLVDESGDSSA